MDELLGTRAQPERWSRSGSLCAEVGTGRAVLSRPFPRSDSLPPLRFGQFFLDEAEHFLQNRMASVATLRWCSGSSRNVVRLPFGNSVRLRRNRHCAARVTEILARVAVEGDDQSVNNTGSRQRRSGLAYRQDPTGCDVRTQPSTSVPLPSAPDDRSVRSHLPSRDARATHPRGQPVDARSRNLASMAVARLL